MEGYWVLFKINLCSTECDGDQLLHFAFLGLGNS